MRCFVCEAALVCVLCEGILCHSEAVKGDDVAGVRCPIIPPVLDGLKGCQGLSIDVS